MLWCHRTFAMTRARKREQCLLRVAVDRAVNVEPTGARRFHGARPCATSG